MIYADFGAHDFALATLHLQMACQAALRCDLHKIDRSAVLSSAADATFLDACRQVWWEVSECLRSAKGLPLTCAPQQLWILDSVLDIASSGQVARNLANVHAEVNTPFGGKEVRLSARRLRAAHTR